MKVYISGGISGLPIVLAKERFLEAESQVVTLGFEPVNPFNNGLEDSACWNEHMVADIAMLLECGAIYLLEGWQKSRGARIEVNIARECGLQILVQS